MIKIGTIFKRQGRCPLTGERPTGCETCQYVKTRGPETGEANIFPKSQPFCTYEVADQ